MRVHRQRSDVTRISRNTEKALAAHFNIRVHESGRRVMTEKRKRRSEHKEPVCYFAHHLEACVKKLLSSFIVDCLGSVIHHGVVTHQLEIGLNIGKNRAENTTLARLKCPVFTNATITFNQSVFIVL